MVHIYVVENFSFRIQACQNFGYVRIFQNLCILHFLGNSWKLRTFTVWLLLTLHTEKVMSCYKAGEISHTVWEIFTSPSAAASLWAALWKVWRRGARGTKIQQPTSVAEKIYPWENVGYHCREPPLNGFQLCRNCCQGDWSRCLSCRGHLVSLLGQKEDLLQVSGFHIPFIQAPS